MDTGDSSGEQLELEQGLPEMVDSVPYYPETAQVNGAWPAPVPSQMPRTKAKPGVSCFNAIFATRQLAPKGNREQHMAFSVREFFIYLFYLITFTIIVVGGMTSEHKSQYTRVMQTLFVTAKVTESDTGSHPAKTFEASSDVFDFWKYLLGPMIDGIYWEKFYGPTPNLDVRNLTDLELENGILYENQLMGVPRLRQIRVKLARCPVDLNFRFLQRDCYPRYSRSDEDPGIPFRNAATGARVGIYWDDVNLDPRNPVREAWKYKTGGFWHWGRLATYSGNGGQQNLEHTAERTRAAMNSLKSERWITRATRAVFLDFTVYNANINLFCVVKLIWEFPFTGGLVTSYSLRTVRLIRYVDSIDFYVILPCEFLFVLFTLYYLVQELTEMAYLGYKEYVGDIWSWFDLINLVISFLCIIFSVARYFMVKNTLMGLTTKVNSFPDFEFLSFWESVFISTASVSLFFAYLKLFKYVSFNETMAQLANTLTWSAKDVLGFSLMFFIVFFAFAQLGNLIFGSQLEDYCTILDTVFTLLRLLMGDFNFLQLQLTNPVLGPIYFISYAFFVFFVLVNMLLAIINDTYAEVKAEIHTRRMAFEMADYIKGTFNRVRGAFGKRNQQIDYESAVKLAAADGQITQDEFRDNLLRHGFNSVDVEMFLTHFELGKEDVLEEDDATTFLAELEGQEGSDDHKVHTSHYHREHVGLCAVDPTPVLPEEIDGLQRELGRAEVVITELLNQIAQHDAIGGNADQGPRSEAEQQQI